MNTLLTTFFTITALLSCSFSLIAEGPKIDYELLHNTVDSADDATDAEEISKLCSDLSQHVLMTLLQTRLFNFTPIDLALAKNKPNIAYALLKEMEKLNIPLDYLVHIAQDITNVVYYRRRHPSIHMGWSAMAFALPSSATEISIEDNRLYQALKNQCFDEVCYILNTLRLFSSKDNIKNFLIKFTDQSGSNLLDFAFESKSPRIIVLVFDFFKEYAPEEYKKWVNKNSDIFPFTFELCDLSSIN
ncbi:MAG: hypothetical protein H6679_04475 [Epsilonproteobacteria bacterium]|nr:hypothetical protein [Campylobacterota bacterium]